MMFQWCLANKLFVIKRFFLAINDCNQCDYVISKSSNASAVNDSTGQDEDGRIVLDIFAYN